MSRFNWLHLTDLHFGLGGQKPLWPNIKQAFLTDLEKLHKHTGPWDVVFFSDDFVQQGKEAEFKDLEERVLGPLWVKMKEFGSEPVIPGVPGYHDLVRPRNISEISEHFPERRARYP